MFLRDGRAGTHTAWWLVPIGVVFIAIGAICLSTDSDNIGTKALIVGAVCIVGGVVLGIRGERFR